MNNQKSLWVRFVLDIKKRRAYVMTIIKNWNRVLREEHNKHLWRAHICGGFSHLVFLKIGYARFFQEYFAYSCSFCWQAVGLDWPLRVLLWVLYSEVTRNTGYFLEQNWKMVLNKVAVNTHIVISMLRLNRLPVI